MTEAVTAPQSQTSRVALISGAASGIGLATARTFARYGWSVVVADLDGSAATDAVGNLEGAGHMGLQLDVTSTCEVERAVAETASAFGRIDAVIPLAGILRPGSSAEVPDQDIQLLLDIHLMGTIRLARAAYPYLKRTQGNVVGISSMGAHLGLAGRLGYNAAKSAVEAVIRTLAVEWAEDGIRANAVAPAWVKTPAIASLIEDGYLDPLPVEARTAMHRFAEPGEVGEAIEFLASGRASFITGTVLKVDGGMTVQFPLPTQEGV